MSEKTLELREFEQLVRDLERAREIAMPHVQQAMENSLAALDDVLKEYPPSTEANQPGRFSLKTHRLMGYYERGRGWWYPVMRKKTLGPQAGKRAGAVALPKHLRGMARAAGYKLRRTSERLGTKWTRQVMTTDDAVVGEIGTTVSYADYVQGDRQSRIHQARGWKTADEALDEVESDILGFFGQAMEAIAKEITGK